MNLVKIKDLFHFEKGTLQSTKATPGEFDFITAAADWKTHNEFTHEGEALIFAAAASGSLGRTHYVNGKFISSDLCFIITPKDPEKYPIDLNFYHLIFNAFKDEIVRNTKAGTSKEAIGLTVFGNYKLPYFDIIKQQAIKETFLSAQDLSQSLDKELSNQLELIKNIRQAFLKEAIRGNLVDQDPNDEPAILLLEKIKKEKEQLIKAKKIKKPNILPVITKVDLPFNIPKNWTWCRIGDITLNCDGLRVPLSKYERSLRKGEYDYYGAQGVIDNIDDYKFNGTYLLIAEDGQNLLRKNKPVAFLASGKFWVNNHAHVSDCFHDVTRIMIANYINSIDLSPYISGKPPSQIKLKRSELDSIIFPLAPLSEQNRIDAKLNEIMNYCDELEKIIISSRIRNEFLLDLILRESLGFKTSNIKNENIEKKLVSNVSSKYDSNTLYMEIKELLKLHGRLQSLELWQMSKFYGKSDEERDIDGFYADLKKLIEKEKVVKETEKGYLELV